MEKFRYGPLIYAIAGESETEDANFYWTGLPPVAYDSDGIPVDSNGLQCLPDSCPVHPAYKPTEFEHNSTLNDMLPTIDSISQWFEDNFLEVTTLQCCKYALRWYVFNQRKKSDSYYEITSQVNSIEEAIGKIWPDVQT